MIQAHAHREQAVVLAYRCDEAFCAIEHDLGRALAQGWHQRRVKCHYLVAHELDERIVTRENSIGDRVEARQRVAEINRAQRKRADEQAWQEATLSDTVEAYKAYLKGQPNGIFKDAALARFEAIWAEVRRKAEEDRKRAEAERQREEAERKRAEEERKRAEALRNENLGCWNSSGNRSLRACTRIIESKSLYRKHFGADDLAKVYSNRGVEYSLLP